MANIYVGDLTRVTATFTNASGTLVNPTAVYFGLQRPNLFESVYIFGADPEVIRESTGVYYFNIDCVYPGTWTYVWRCTGATAQDASEGFITVLSTFLPSPYAP